MLTLFSENQNVRGSFKTASNRSSSHNTLRYKNENKLITPTNHFSIIFLPLSTNLDLSP